MPELLLVAGTFVLAAVATAALLIVRSRLDRSHSDRIRRLEECLAESHTVERTHLERPPAVRELAVVERIEDDEPVYVPVVRVELGMTDPPSMELVFEFVASVLEAIHPVLEEKDVRVRHYDVQFTFGPSGLFVSRLCQRVSIPPALADRLCADARYRPIDLRRDVESGDDGGDETAPVLWGSCRPYRSRGD
ncbi:hypothetical protein [Natronosalvus vescus]|uniref:hypothetical protein n=1 Tax=Natronosalvus vescus TaxID=2953881 RepID=UPI0020900F0A|nr:hypothetical protein [Natronosalvus vescus]